MQKMHKNVEVKKNVKNTEKSLFAKNSQNRTTSHRFVKVSIKNFAPAFDTFVLKLNKKVTFAFSWLDLILSCIIFGSQCGCQKCIF